MEIRGERRGQTTGTVGRHDRDQEAMRMRSRKGAKGEVNSGCGDRRSLDRGGCDGLRRIQSIGTGGGGVSAWITGHSGIKAARYPGTRTRLFFPSSASPEFHSSSLLLLFISFPSSSSSRLLVVVVFPSCFSLFSSSSSSSSSLSSPLPFNRVSSSAFPPS